MSRSKPPQHETKQALARSLFGKHAIGHSRLTPAQSRFCLLIVAGLPSAEAYREAFNRHDLPRKELATRGSRLMRHKGIKDGITQREMWACAALAVDKTFVLGNLADLSTQREDHKAAVRALELLGRHLEPGFYGDNKPIAPIPQNPAELVQEIRGLLRDLGPLARVRGDADLVNLVATATAELEALPAPDPATVEGESQPDRSATSPDAAK